MGNHNPLISICIPVFNGGSSIWRALESCINQTYRNIEVVVVDNASTDNTDGVVKKYADRDQRIRYFKNQKTTGPFENFVSSFERATGDFIQLLAHDDWISRDHIMEAVRLFNSYPEIAAVFAKYISYYDDGKSLKFDQVITMKPGFYSAHDYFRKMYKTQIGFFSIYSVIRTKDMIEAAVFTQHFFASPPKDIPKEFQDLCKAGFGIDIMVFLKVMLKYDLLVFASSSAFIKTVSENNYGKTAGESIDMNKATGIIKNYDFFRTCHEFLYKSDLRKYLWGLRFFVGIEGLTSIFLFYIKRKFPKYFFNDFSSKDVNNFFRDYSFWEKAAVVICVVPHFFKRLFRAVWFRIRKQKVAVCGPDLFLDKNLDFKV